MPIKLLTFSMEDAALDFIISCVQQKKIIWTHHVNMRLEGRFIPRESILSSTGTYEIIEQYPEDKYLPSYLIYAEHEGDMFHIQIAIDREETNVRIITAYRPTLEKWEEGFKKRRKK